MTAWEESLYSVHVFNPFCHLHRQHWATPYSGSITPQENGRLDGGGSLHFVYARINSLSHALTHTYNYLHFYSHIFTDITLIYLPSAVSSMHAQGLNLSTLFLVASLVRGHGLNSSTAFPCAFYIAHSDS